MKLKIKNKVFEKEANQSFIEQQVSAKITEILSQYENGIDSIFELSKKEDEENYLMLLFNCPDSFHQKYSNINKSNSTLFNHSMILKLYNGIEKKKSKKYEKKNEITMSQLNSIYFQDYLVINIEEEKNDYIIMIKNVFEKYFSTNEFLLEELIKRYLLLRKSENNNEFDYEDFIIIFCSIIKYYSGLNISLELNEFENYLLIFIYGDDKSYTNICSIFNYQLQLLPIAIDYEKYYNKKIKDNDLNEPLKEGEIIDNNEEEPLLLSFHKSKKTYNLKIMI